MIRTYNIGTECYALITSASEPELLIPVKVILLEKYTTGDRVNYKVRITDIFERDINFLKEHFGNIKYPISAKTEVKSTIIRKGELNSVNSLSELLQKLYDKPFFIEGNYITPDKDGLVDLYNRFVRYMINYHFRKLYQLTSRNFLINQPVFINQKDIFQKRVERLGFGDVFQKYNLKLDI